jgi:hypothetical protein
MYLEGRCTSTDPGLVFIGQPPLLTRHMDSPGGAPRYVGQAPSTEAGLPAPFLKISILTVSSGIFLLLYPDNSGITCCYTKYFLVAISNEPDSCLSIQNSNIRLSRIELSFWKVPWYHFALKILKHRFCYQADMLVWFVGGSFTLWRGILQSCFRNSTYCLLVPNQAVQVRCHSLPFFLLWKISELGFRIEAIFWGICSIAATVQPKTKDWYFVCSVHVWLFLSTYIIRHKFDWLFSVCVQNLWILSKQMLFRLLIS